MKLSYYILQESSEGRKIEGPFDLNMLASLLQRGKILPSDKAVINNGQTVAQLHKTSHWFLLSDILKSNHVIRLGNSSADEFVPLIEGVRKSSIQVKVESQDKEKKTDRNSIFIALAVVILGLVFLKLATPDRNFDSLSSSLSDCSSMSGEYSGDFMVSKQPYHYREEFFLRVSPSCGILYTEYSHIFETNEELMVRATGRIKSEGGGYILYSENATDTQTGKYMGITSYQVSFGFRTAFISADGGRQLNMIK